MTEHRISSISPISASSFLRFLDLSFEDAANALSEWWERERARGLGGDR